MSSACAPSAQHRLQRARHHAPLGADPTGVDRRDHTGARVGQQHRHAVGGHHRQRQSRRAGHQRVGVVDRSVARPVDHLDPVTVDLVHPHHAVGAEADRGGQPGPVGGHRRRVVTDVVAEVEGVERRLRDAARAGGGHPPDANAHVSSIRDCCHAGSAIRPGRFRAGSNGPQRRMNGGTSTSSSSPPMFSGRTVGVHRHADRVDRFEQRRGELAGLRRLDPVRAGLLRCCRCRPMTGLRPGRWRRSPPR